MKILSVDCSASPASAAITENGKIIASAYTNVKITHSQTLMPMIESVLNTSQTDFAQIGGLAVSYGPGSFTGIRIGISAIKGLAAPENIPCVGVSTLLAMAYNLLITDCIVCAVMDARCNQVYNGIFDISGGTVTRLCPDRALMCEELKEEIKKISQTGEKRIIIVGDGTDLFYEYVKDLPNVSKATENLRYQNAVSVGIAAEKQFETGNTVSAAELLPFYLRLPQAQRNLINKNK